MWVSIHVLHIYIILNFSIVSTSFQTHKYKTRFLFQCMLIWYPLMLLCGISLCSFFFLFFNQPYPSTAGGDLSMLSPLHAGFEPTLPRWLSAGWKGYYISYDTICICTLTLHQPQTSSPNWLSHLFSHILATTVSPPTGHLETIVVASHC